MLKNIEITDFRSCKNVKISGLREVLVLIGRNGAGKTNILKAIDWVCRFAAANGVKKEGVRRALVSEDGEVALTFEFEGKQYCYELIKHTILGNAAPWEEKTEIIERIFVCDGGNQAKTLEIQRNGARVEITRSHEHVEQILDISEQISCLTALRVFLPESHPSRILSETVLRFLAAVRYYPLHNYDESIEEQWVIQSRYVKWKSEKDKEPNSISYLLYRLLQLHLERPDTFEELNALIGENGLNVVKNISVIRHSLGKSETGDTEAIYFINFTGSGSDTKHFINNLSFGTKRVLFLLVSLLYDDSPVFLLEQPEDGIHIGLVEKLHGIITSYASRSQFLIASHSTTILNQVSPDEVIFVANNGGITQARALSPVELSAADRFLRENGPLSDFVDSIQD